MVMMSAQQQAQVAAILAKFDTLNATVQAGYAAILAKLDTMDQNTQANLLALLSSVNSLSTNVQTGINTLIGLINNLSPSQQVDIAAILAKMNEMETQQHQDILSILAAINGMNSAQQQAYAQILAAIGQINTGVGQELMLQFLARLDQIIANQGTMIQNQQTMIQDLAQLIADIQSGNATMSAINAYLHTMQFGNNEVDLSAIEALLSSIYAQSQTNGNLLSNVNQNVQFVTTAVNNAKSVIEAKLDTLTGIERQELATQISILEAMPDSVGNCTCSQCCADIIQRLDTIIVKLIPGTNHEGYEDISKASYKPSSRNGASRSQNNTSRFFGRNFKPSSKTNGKNVASVSGQWAPSSFLIYPQGGKLGIAPLVTKNDLDALV